MRLRVRGPQGVISVTIPDDSTWGDLQKEISQKTSVADYDVKYGYPPKALNIESIDSATKLTDLEVNLSGEQLIIMPRDITTGLRSPMAGSELNPQSVKALPNTSASSARQSADSPLNLTRKTNADIESEPPEIPVPLLDGLLVLRVMPDDNSCMFRALSNAVLGGALDGMTELRQVVAQTIQAQPDIYSAAILEKEPQDYCRWIKREDAWGGGIELSILSQHFDIEICSINVQDLRTDRFNEGKPTRCILVYSGIHYDVLAITPVSGMDPEFDRKVFDVARMDGGDDEDAGVLQAAVELCQVLQGRHYFTDTKGFDVKCNVCQLAGKGEQWATLHAKASGHMDFVEAG